MELTPSSVMAMWAGGVAAGGALVARWRVVGPGFVWLAAGVTVMLGVPGILAGDVWSIAGLVLALAVALTARLPAWNSTLGLAAAFAFVVAAALETAPAAAISGAAFLGSVTSEMMLGHWYLVDPRLPRWSLRRLSLVGGAASLVDFGVLAILGAIPWEASDTAIGLGFVVLAASTITLMAAVVGALKAEGYSGVMAATGLSYLALLTALGAAVVGRMLAAGPVL